MRQDSESTDLVMMNESKDDENQLVKNETRDGDDKARRH
jgi:hypothetical protein